MKILAEENKVSSNVHCIQLPMASSLERKTGAGFVMGAFFAVRLGLSLGALDSDTSQRDAPLGRHSDCSFVACTRRDSLNSITVFGALKILWQCCRAA